ncbi:MAG: carboxypeptidase regulatory-like domain-containing protein [Pyrinomonadaceae bacterium]
MPCFAFVLCLNAQDLDDVTISGRITDSNKLPIVGAMIKVTNQSSGQERTVMTNEDGRYRIVDLPPGPYKVNASAKGFGAKERIDISTIAAQNLQFDFSLAPADVQAAATVTVNDNDGPLVDTTKTIVGGTITEREIEELPNNSRNALDLVLTLGGTSEEALSTKDLAEDRATNPRSTPLEQGNFSLSGGAAYSNNITIDGLDNNDDRGARDRFQPSLEAISEVQVIRNQFSSEYGRASGGRVNIRTRSGTNTLRGRAYMFFRDDNLNANSWYNNQRKYTPIPPLVPPDTNPLFNRLPFTEYIPGFTLGGPIVLPRIYDGHNRTFFFVAYEHDRYEDTTLIDTWIPVVPNPHFTLPAPTGSAQFCDTNGGPPAPCAAGVGAVSAYNFLLDTPNVSNIWTARVDHRLFTNNEITFGWQLGRKKNQRTGSGSVTRIEDALQAKDIDTDAFNITDNHVFGSSLVNQAKFQWSVFEPGYITATPFDPVVLVGYRNPTTNGLQTLIAGNSTSSTNQNFSDNRKETRNQFVDSLTYIRGNHTFKFGADVQHVNSEAISLADATGTYNFSSVFTYSNNTVTRYRQNFGTASDVTNTYWGAFFNDEFRLRPNLTMSYGLRYERETAVTDNDNFGPRIGIAWDPFNKGKGVIRVGAGIFYNRVLLRTVGDFIQNSLGGQQSFDSNSIPTSGTINNRTNVLASISQDFPNGYADMASLQAAIMRATCGTVSCNPNTGFLEALGNGSNPLRTVDPDLKIPESYQFNIGFEREIGKGFIFEANYTFNKSVHLWREYNPNAAVAPAGYADLTAWLLANSYTFTNSNNTVRTYRFWMGPTTDTVGLATNISNPAAPTGTCGNNVNVTCWVNLNTVNGSTTAPSTAANSVGVNSIGSPVGVSIEAVRPLRPDPDFDERERVSSIGNADYHGLVLEIRRSYRSIGYGFGVSMRGVYTLSRMRDDGLNNTTNAEVNGNFGREWARATQDRRHRFAFTATFDTPNWFGKLRFSPLFRYGSSAPFSLGLGVDRNLDDVSTDRVLFSGDLDDIRWRQPGTPFPTELTSQFSLLPIGAKGIGNIPRNAGHGPSMYLFDMTVSREWKFTERYRLRPAIEFGNILNASAFSYGSEFIDFFGNPTALQQANFLVPSRTYRARDIKLGIRFDF